MPASRRRCVLRAASSKAVAAATMLLVAGCGRGGVTVAPRAETAPADGRDAAPVPAPGRMPPGAVVQPFTLTDSGGLPFESGALLGKVWVASVFFANCPGPCFRENQALADVLRAVPDEDFMVVSVTCDPDNDTPDVLRRYADRFQADPARWKFLTGDMASIKKIANESFLLPAEVGVHSERGVVFDRRGRLRGSYHLLQPDRVKLLVDLVREVLAEPVDETPLSSPQATAE